MYQHDPVIVRSAVLVHLVCLGIQHQIQRFLDRTPDDLIQVAPDLGLTNSDNLAQWFRGFVFHGGPLGFVQFSDDYCFNKPGPPLHQMCEK